VTGKVQRRPDGLIAQRLAEEAHMYKHILVAVDGSDTSRAALTEAIKLAQDRKSSLRLVHVVDLPLPYSDISAPTVLTYRDALEAEGREVIEDCSAVVRAAGVQFDTQLTACENPGQKVYDAIEAEAKRWPADLVVVGTEGRRGISRLFLGSVAEGLARISSKPLLLIRAG
jgi:nucleotide-binding universal stress UspA family protein